MSIDPVYRRMIANFRKSPNWDSELDVYVLQKLWPSLVGAKLAAATTIVSIQGSRVVINVPDRVWRRQLVVMTKQLLQRLNEPWPIPFITEIAFTHEDYRS